MRKTILFFFVFILLVPIAISQPPFDVTIEPDVIGLQIEFPLIFIFEQNKDIIFNYHVFNFSDLKPVTNATTNCSFHLFDNTGEHLINQMAIPFDGTGLDYEVTISGTNFTRIGAYATLVNCISSWGGGVHDHRFRVTADGEDDTQRENTAVTTITIFLLLVNLIVFALPFWVKSFAKSKAANFIIKRLLWLTSILLLWFNTTIFRTIAIDYNLGIDNFLIVYWWMFTLGTFMVVFLMCYFMVVGLLQLMKEARMDKRLGKE